MKLMIASDIHGSALWCGKLLDKWKQEGSPRMLLLGDILYHGPRNDLPEGHAPKQVIEMLNPLRDSLFCVRGNCEAEVDQMVLQFPVLADYCLIPVGERMMYCTHGHIYNEQNLPPMRSGDILLYGHTHVPRAEKSGPYYMLNPGSIALPKEGSAHSCAILEDSVFTICDLNGGGKVMKIDLH